MNHRILIGALVIIIGIGWLFGINILRIIVPVLLILLGIQIVLGRRCPAQWKMDKSTVGENSINEVLIFSAMNKRFDTQKFRGGKVVVLFSGGEVDLSQVKTEGTEVTLEVVAIFGGVKVRIPTTWSVVSEGVGIIGGFSNGSASPQEPVANLKLKGVAIFGGVEIIN